MSQKITPFMWFDKEAEEAMNFYTSIFSNAPTSKGVSKIESITRYPEGPLEAPMKGMEGKVLTGVFTLGGQKFMALDGGPVFKANGAISFYIECEDQEEVDYFWEKLTEAGDPKAQKCGWLQDKFGFSWQIVPKALPEILTRPDKAKADQAMQTMLQMKKIDIEALEKAYNQ